LSRKGPEGTFWSAGNVFYQYKYIPMNIQILHCKIYQCKNSSSCAVTLYPYDLKEEQNLGLSLE
jgi:hypothetical protein